MLKLYELLAKVGTNPKLRAWAMEQLINLKKLKPGYKKGFSHEMDLKKVKDIKNPNWQVEKIAKEKAYNLKNKIVDITKAKDKLKWNKIEKTQDKDKFYGVTGQVNTWLKKIKDEGIAWEKQIAKEDAWFNKLMKAKVKGDPRAIKILDDYFKKQKKDFADKIIPFKPKKAEGGIIEEVWDKKGIETAKESLEGMKPHLMEESYIQLLDFLDSKQKELDIDIMEDAGGLGEMLGEGGRAGFQGGDLVEKWNTIRTLQEKLGKKNPEILDMSINEFEIFLRENKYYGYKGGGRVGMMYGGDPGFAFSYGGSWADWKDNHASEMPLMDYINQKLPKARNPFSDSSYANGGPVNLNQLIQMYMEEGMSHEDAVQAAEAAQNLPWDTLTKAEGGRIGMAEGDTPSEAYLRDLYYDGGWDDRGDIGLHEFMHGPIGWKAWQDYIGKAEGGRIGFKKGSKKGGIGDLMGELYRLFEISPLLASPELMDVIQKIPFDKGGKVKKGGGPKMSRRSFLQLMGGLASLPIVGKYFKLAKTKPVQDFSVKLKTYFHNSDVDYGTTGNAFFDISALTAPVKRALYGIMKNLPANKVGGKSGIPKDYNTISPGNAKHVIKKLQDQGFKGKLTGIVDEGGDVLKQAEKMGQKNFVKTYKKQSMKQNVKDHQQYNDYVLYENDPGFMNWRTVTKGKLDKPYVSTIDEVVEILEPVVKKAEGGSVGYPPLQPEEKPPFQGPPYETNNPNEAIKEILRRGLGSGIAGAPIGGGFSLDMPYGEGSEFDIGLGYQTENPYGFAAGYGVDLEGDDTMGARYTGDTFNIGVKKQEGSNPQWNFQKKWKFAKGGKAWRPKSAPKLTTTIPPERGPTPQGLTYLTGDDIVQNIG